MKGLLAPLLLATALAVVPGAHSTDVSQSISACAAIPGDLSRLECYDKVSASLGLGARKPEPKRKEGNWGVAAVKNPLDDSKTVVASLRAETGTSKTGDAIGLVLRCQSKKVELYITWAEVLGSGDTASVLTRAGDQEPRTSEWKLSSDKTATFIQGDAIKSVKILMQAKKLVAQVTPPREEPRTAVFDLTGIEDAVRHIQEVCPWPK